MHFYHALRLFFLLALIGWVIAACAPTLAIIRLVH